MRIKAHESDGCDLLCFLVVAFFVVFFTVSFAEAGASASFFAGLPRLGRTFVSPLAVAVFTATFFVVAADLVTLDAFAAASLGAGAAFLVAAAAAARLGGIARLEDG